MGETNDFHKNPHAIVVGLIHSFVILAIRDFRKKLGAVVCLNLILYS